VACADREQAEAEHLADSAREDELRRAQREAEASSACQWQPDREHADDAFPQQHPGQR
jgi:hypothetical protein